jgi:hypothetical protein
MMWPVVKNLILPRTTVRPALSTVQANRREPGSSHPHDHVVQIARRAEIHLADVGRIVRLLIRRSSETMDL